MKTADRIYQEMCNNYKEITGVSVNDGCDMAIRLYAAAAQIESLYVYNDWVKKQCFPQTATGEYLDLHAEMRGLKRIEAGRSMGYIRFLTESPANRDIEIPQGTICVTASGLRFETYRSGTIGIGETSCECLSRAIEKGTDGNVKANTVVYMEEAPIGVSSCFNELDFVGGTDAEDDNALRERILANYSSLPNGANAAFYEKLVMNVSGVSAAKVLPKIRGLGTVDIVITGTEGLPSATLINRVLNEIDEAREICVDIQVYGPSTKTVDVEIGIEVESEYSFDTVSEEVKKAIGDYFTGELLGCEILKAMLGSIIYSVEGVHNYAICDPMEDVEINSTELPVLGTLTVKALS